LTIDLFVSCEIHEVLGWPSAARGNIVYQNSELVVDWGAWVIVLQGHFLASKQMLLVGPGCGIEEGGLDQTVVSFGAGVRLCKGNIAKESPVTATCVVTLGSSDISILHRLGPSGVAHLPMVPLLFEIGNHALQFFVVIHEVHHFLLLVQIVGVVGIKNHIEATHADRSTLSGRVLIECSLDMVTSNPFCQGPGSKQTPMMGIFLMSAQHKQLMQLLACLQAFSK